MVVSCNNHHIPYGYLAHHINTKPSSGAVLLFLSLRYPFGIPSVKCLGGNEMITVLQGYYIKIAFSGRSKATV